MLGVAEHKLKCVLARRQFNTCLGLPRPEMKMVLVLRNRIIWIESIRSRRSADDDARCSQNRHRHVSPPCCADQNDTKILL